MTTIHIQHAVRDFAAWKHAFDQDPLRRGRNGVVRHVVARSAEDPNLVFIQLHFAKREDAEAYMPALRGLFPSVDDAIGFGPDGPKAWLLDDVEDVTY